MSKRHRLLKRDRYRWARMWRVLERPDPARNWLGGFYTNAYKREMRRLLSKKNSRLVQWLRSFLASKTAETKTVTPFYATIRSDSDQTP